MRQKSDPSPIDLFLAPLARIAQKHPLIEGLVFWGDDDGWSDQPSEALEPEEIAFYAEGLLLDGFHMDWAHVTGTGDDHLRLCFWQDGSPPADPVGQVLASGRWTGT